MAIFAREPWEELRVSGRNRGSLISVPLARRFSRVKNNPLLWNSFGHAGGRLKERGKMIS